MNERPQSSPVSVEPWRQADDPNATAYATKCFARGRYEIALAFREASVGSFEKALKRMKSPMDSPQDIQRARQVLSDQKTSLKEFKEEIPKLIASRARLLTLLRENPQITERNEVGKLVMHTGTTTFGVICNQLARGNWLIQTMEGNNFHLKYSIGGIVSNERFLMTEIDPPRSGPFLPT